MERQVKMVLVGAPQVGKTSIALRYTQDSINKAYQVTTREANQYVRLPSRDDFS